MENRIPIVLLNQGLIEKTNIYLGNYELIDSRSVILFDSEIPIQIEEVFNSKFKIILRFISQKDDAGIHNIQVNVDIQNNIIEYKCMNFDNPLGTGTNKPIEIGTISGKKVYVHFWLYALGGDNGVSRKLEYSVWKEK